MHGVVNFLKPPGMTSHDAVSFVRRVANNKRVGHTGTLDPAAAGVLAICVGQATRLVEYLQAGRKTYIAEITLGIETDSHDATGNVVSETDASAVDLESLRSALDAFRGRIQQTPPIFSAIKVDGQKLYDLARSGVEENQLEIASREVEIFSLVVTRFTSSTRSDQKPRAMLRIECGSGTYIRSLVRDIGRALGCGATMTFLVRTQNGAFDIDEAFTPEQIEKDFAGALVPIVDAMKMCAAETFTSDDWANELSQGRDIDFPIYAKFHQQPQNCEMQEEVLTLFRNSGGNVLIMAKKRPPHEQNLTKALIFKPEKVFFLDRDE